MNARDFFASKQGLAVIAVVALASIGTYALVADREPARGPAAAADRELAAPGLAPTGLAPSDSGDAATAPVSVERSTGPDGTVLSPGVVSPVAQRPGARGRSGAPVSDTQREPGTALAPATPASPAAASARLAPVREFTLPAGTQLRVRLANSLTTATANVEDAVNGTLENSLVDDGVTVVPAGSAISGQVVESVRSGKVKGRGRLSIRFTSLRPDGADEAYPIRTRTWTKVAEGQAKKDAATIGIPAAGGAIVGGIIGGKKGAVIGGATGGGAGTAVVLTQRGPEVQLGAGAVVSVRLAEPLTVRVR